jgi:hypothetical protein
MTKSAECHTDEVPKTIEVIVYTYVSGFSAVTFTILTTHP